MQGLPLGLPEGSGLTAGALLLSALLASTSPLALLGWDGRLDLSVFTPDDWCDYRGADAD